MAASQALILSTMHHNRLVRSMWSMRSMWRAARPHCDIAPAYGWKPPKLAAVTAAPLALLTTVFKHKRCSSTNAFNVNTLQSCWQQTGREGVPRRHRHHHRTDDV